MLHELSAAPSPLSLCIVCIPGEIWPGKCIFSTAVVFSQERKNKTKKVKEKKKVLWSPIPSHPPLLTPPLLFSHG